MMRASTVWLPSASWAESIVKLVAVSPACTTPSISHSITGLLLAGTKCVNENVCRLGAMTVTDELAGEVEVITFTIAFVILTMFSWQTRHSA